jgi:hypothetical protein
LANRSLFLKLLDGAEFLRSPLIEVTHQPLQILGGGREVELLRYVPQSSQLHSAKVYLLFETSAPVGTAVGSTRRPKPTTVNEAWQI